MALGRRAYDRVLSPILILQILMMAILFGLNIYYLARVRAVEEGLKLEVEKIGALNEAYYGFLNKHMGAFE